MLNKAEYFSFDDNASEIVGWNGQGIADSVIKVSSWINNQIHYWNSINYM